MSVQSFISVFLYNFMVLLFMLISVAFLTLFERKLLSYIQFRKGPNKVGILGIFQPFSDAIKLFMKENLILMKINKVMYFSNPMMGFLFSLMGWMYLFSNFYEYLFMEFGVLLMVSLMMVSSYTVMFSGWSSNSNYSMLGAIRGLSQSLSYEISFFLIIFILIILVESFELSNFYIFQSELSFFWFMFPLFLMFYLSIIAELNRSPFDLMEGESELVSGFNTEYMSGSFALIFLGEYSFIILYNYLMILVFLGMKSIFMFMMLIFMNSMIIVLRSICPRIRYDQLMYLCWLKILPLSLFYMIFVMNLKIF